MKPTISVHLGVQHHIAETPVYLDSRYVLLRYLPGTPIGWIIVKEIYFVMQLASISLFPFPRPILAFFPTGRIEYKPFSKDGLHVAFTHNLVVLPDPHHACSYRVVRYFASWSPRSILLVSPAGVHPSYPSTNSPTAESF